MKAHPVWSAMRHNKVGATLIAVQIAVTLAILCNALFIVQQRLAFTERPTGVDEADTFVMTNDWAGDTRDPVERVRGDLATLRSLPGVVGAYATNAYPLEGGGASLQISLDPEHFKTTPAAVYLGDEQTLRTLGLRLVAGRNFRPEDAVDVEQFNAQNPSGVMVTEALARRLFPGGHALGQRVYLEGQGDTTPIIGIIAKLQVPWTRFGGWASTWSDSSILVPARDATSVVHYIVRAQAGRLSQLMKIAPQRLYSLNHDRLIDPVRSLLQARSEIYRDDRGFAVILSVVCGVLLGVTAFGIVGLTSYWVAQRRHQIGVRRALGATRPAILRHFQSENLVITAAGGIVGLALGVAANLWMVESFAMARLPLAYLIAGAIVVLGLGQLAVLWPALRAASVPPAVAARSA